MLDHILVLMTLYHGLQLVWSKSTSFGDTKCHIQYNGRFSLFGAAQLGGWVHIRPNSSLQVTTFSHIHAWLQRVKQYSTLSTFLVLSEISLARHLYNREVQSSSKRRRSLLIGRGAPLFTLKSTLFALELSTLGESLNDLLDSFRQRSSLVAWVPLCL